MASKSRVCWRSRSRPLSRTQSVGVIRVSSLNEVVVKLALTTARVFVGVAHQQPGELDGLRLLLLVN